MSGDAWAGADGRDVHGMTDAEYNTLLDLIVRNPERIRQMLTAHDGTAQDRARTLPPGVERLRVITPEPGDVIIATIPMNLDRDEVDGVYTLLKATFPDQNVLALGSDLELGVYRPITPTPREDPTS